MPTATALCALLVDTCSMMREEGGRRLIDMAADVVTMVLADAPTARVVAFSSLPIELIGLGAGTRSLRLPEPHLRNVQLPHPDGSQPPALPAPGGSTALHLALNFVGKMMPRVTCLVVVSDGEPDSVEAALTSARALAPVELSGFYVGPDDNPAALKFMADLAQAGGAAPGASGARSLAKPAELASEIAGLLAGPSR